MSNNNELLDLLDRLHDHGVRYILIGGQAVRFHGFMRTTEDIDLVVPMDEINGERLINALSYLDSATELETWWFSKESHKEEIQNIRVADRLVIDILFAANGQTFESLQGNVIHLNVGGVDVVTLNVDGILKTKTDYREKDLLDRMALLRIKQGLAPVSSNDASLENDSGKTRNKRADDFTP